MDAANEAGQAKADSAKGSAQLGTGTSNAPKHAPAPNTPQFTREEDLHAYHEMLLIRRFEEKAGQLYGMGLIGAYDRAKQAMMLETDRIVALREAILSCRNGGTVSVIGVYGGFVDKFPFGAVVNRSLTIKAGQAHVQHYMGPLLERIQNGEIDPSFVITHRLPLDEAPSGYKMFRDKQDECLKVVLKP